jgi:type VI secretion system protein ImpK
MGAYLGFRTVLGNESESALAHYNDLVKLPPKAAHVTITLP